MSTIKHLRECKKVCSEYGITWGEEQRNKHVRVKLHLGDNVRVFTIAVSDSSKKHGTLFRADVRRWLRDIGVEV